MSDQNIQWHARIIGALYVVLFVLGPMVFLYGKGAVLVPGDVAATAANTRALGEGYRSAIGIEAAIFLIEVLLAALLYVVFRPVSRAVSLASALARFGESVVQGANVLPSLLILAVLGGGAAAFSNEQQDALLSLFQHANAGMVLVWGLFFGLHVLLLGGMVYVSGFLPRWLGVLLLLAGTGYLLQSLGVLLVPSSAKLLDNLVVVMAVPGELLFTLYLLVKGVNVDAWRERARAV